MAIVIADLGRGYGKSTLGAYAVEYRRHSDVVRRRNDRTIVGEQLEAAASLPVAYEQDAREYRLARMQEDLQELEYHRIDQLGAIHRQMWLEVRALQTQIEALSTEYETLMLEPIRDDLERVRDELYAHGWL